MSDAHAKDLRVGNDGWEPLFQIVLFGMFDGDESSSRDDRIPESIGVRTGFVCWGIIEQDGFQGDCKGEYNSPFSRRGI